MVTSEFIFQGFTKKTHQKAISRLFDIPDIKRVIVSVAFVNKSGVDLLERELRKCRPKCKAFIGIRNEITSTQGAKSLLDMGAKLFLVDTGSRHVLFHPKLYLVKGETQARMVIGSANLTLGGLNNNIEAGFALDFNLEIPDEKSIVENIENAFDALVAEYPEHVIAVTKSNQLDALQSSGRLIDETASAPPRPTGAATLPTGDTLSRIKLKVPPIRRALSAARKAVGAPTKAKVKAPGSKSTPKSIIAPPAIGTVYELVWESKSLTRRDLDVPDGHNTHRTGSINLDKGQLAESIDHRHYFRDDVFPLLSWAPSSRPKVEETYAKFQLVLKGISYGEFDLRIAHSTDTTKTSYKQRNAMTRLSWGPMRTYVAQPDLIGRTLALYRDKADPTRFVLEID